MNLRPELLAAPAYHFSAQNCKVKLDQNESPFDLPTNLRAAINQKLFELAFNRYPELNAHSLRQKLAQQINWPAEGLVVSSGSNVLIQALVIAAGIGRTVLSVCPSFSVYSLQAQLLGANLVEVPLKEDFSLPMSSLLRHLNQAEGVFFLANPAAPTANLLATDQLEQLAEASQANWLMVIDEAYHQFSKSNFSYLAKRYSHVVSLRTFSKAFALGGIRLGYALMQEALAEQVQKAIMPFSISALQLAVGETILDNPNYLEEHIELIVAERKRLFKTLKTFKGLTAYPSDTNFILFRVANAEHIYKSLLSQGVLIRRQDHLPGLTGCLRVAVGNAEENTAFLKALEKSLLDTNAETPQFKPKQNTTELIEGTHG